jgi:hypothetical protein
MGKTLATFAVAFVALFVLASTRAAIADTVFPTINPPTLANAFGGPLSGAFTFDNTIVGQTSSLVVVVNDCGSDNGCGSWPVDFIFAGFNTPNPGPFSITDNSCNEAIGSAPQCRFLLNFTPQSAGTFSSAMKVTGIGERFNFCTGVFPFTTCGVETPTSETDLQIFGTGVSGVPGPVAGAGLPGLVAAFGGLVRWMRRRRFNSIGATETAASSCKVSTSSCTQIR